VTVVLCAPRAVPNPKTWRTVGESREWAAQE
jgi:hypothetical protein